MRINRPHYFYLVCYSHRKCRLFPYTTFTNAGQLHFSVLTDKCMCKTHARTHTQSHPQWAYLVIGVAACRRHLSDRQQKQSVVSTPVSAILHVTRIPPPAGDKFPPLLNPLHAKIKSRCILRHLTTF